MQYLYLVQKEGIAGRQLAGLFTDAAVAMGAARIAIAGERDDYHSYSVTPVAVDRPVAQSPALFEEIAGLSGRGNWRGGELSGTPAAWRIRREDDLGRASRYNAVRYPTYIEEYFPT